MIKAKMQSMASISVPKLARAFNTFWIHMSLGNIRRFSFVDDRIIFHMHMLTYEIAGFCVFLVYVFDRVISFRRCVIALPIV